MTDDFQRGIEALLHHSIIDALFEAQLRGLILYNEEGCAIMIKAVEETISELEPKVMVELQRRWVEFILMNFPTAPDGDGILND